MLGVVDVEFTGWGNQSLVLDHCFELERLVVDHYKCRFICLAAPHGEPDFIAGLVVLRLHDSHGSLLDTGVLGDGQHGVATVEFVDVEDRYGLAELGVRVEGGVDIQVTGFGVGLDKQRSTALALE